jgi:hypothetical protein
MQPSMLRSNCSYDALGCHWSRRLMRNQSACEIMPLTVTPRPQVQRYLESRSTQKHLEDNRK